MIPKVTDSSILYSGFFDIRQDLLEKNSGEVLHYTSLILPTHSVAIIAQDTQGLWILNREYRHPTGETILGCPGGRLEPNEDPLMGAQREFFEETGYWCDEMSLIGSCYPFPGLCNQKIYYLLGTNAIRKGEQKLDPFEFIKTELKTEDELQREIASGSKIDGILCTALWYKEKFPIKID